MRCYRCKVKISITESKRMVTQHADGSVYDRTKASQVEPDSVAVKAWHKKCHHIGEKRSAIGGDPVDGRAGPSLNANEIDEAIRSGSTAALSEGWRRRQQEILRDRAADPGHVEYPDRDWRDQQVADLVKIDPDE
jgi:hypothetical protein